MFDPGPWLAERRSAMDTNESARRPVVHDAYAAGEISYSATPGITDIPHVVPWEEGGSRMWPTGPAL